MIILYIDGVQNLEINGWGIMIFHVPVQMGEIRKKAGYKMLLSPESVA